MSLLTCRDVSLGYEGRTVVSGINFTVERGDYLCVVGENGSGKSTLIKSLLGLKEPLSGQIERGDGLRRNEIGYLPQQNDWQRDFPASVWEVVLSGCLNRLGVRPFYSRSEKAETRANLEVLGLWELRDRSFHELSGGQQQRVLLARMLCATRELLLLDEPAAGLDALVTAELYRVIAHLNRDHGVTVVMVSHDLPAVWEHTTKVLHLGQTMQFFGTRDEYAASDAGNQLWGGATSV